MKLVSMGCVLLIFIAISTMSLALEFGQATRTQDLTSLTTFPNSTRLTLTISLTKTLTVPVSNVTSKMSQNTWLNPFYLGSGGVAIICLIACILLWRRFELKKTSSTRFALFFPIPVIIAWLVFLRVVISSEQIQLLGAIFFAISMFAIHIAIYKPRKTM